MKLVPTLLSILLPGLGQLYLGERANGLSLIAASLGMGLVLCFDPSWFTGIFIALAYLSLVYHAAKDAYRGTKNTESIEYILGLTVVCGPFCLPLLWQNTQIRVRGKIIWTIVILILTGLTIASMVYLDPIVNQILDQFLNSETYHTILSS
jgi:hypothetical protein